MLFLSIVFFSNLLLYSLIFFIFMSRESMFVCVCVCMRGEGKRIYFFFFFLIKKKIFFTAQQAVCGILVPQPGIEPTLPYSGSKKS